MNSSNNQTDVAMASPVGPGAMISALFAVVVGALTFIAMMDLPRFNSLMYEDGWGEWTTFFAFALGGIIGCVALLRRMRAESSRCHGDQERAFRFVLLLLSAFCLLAAGEEISWGQRLFGIMPPEVFQKLNDQQELNFHNILIYVISARFVIGVICFGYGLLLPILARRAANQQREPATTVLRVAAPPLFLSPWFALTGVVYWTSPVMLSLEASEMLLGLLLLTDVVLKCQSPRIVSDRAFQMTAKPVVAAFAAMLLGAVASPLVGQFLYVGDEVRIAQARQELEDIAWDLQHAGSIYPEIAKGNRVFDSRLYGAVSDDMVRFTGDSRFYGTRAVASLSADDKKRRTYFLDPWNNPYWISMKGHGRVHLYSFGPNRRLDTIVLHEERVPNESDLAGDDIAVWVDVYDGERPVDGPKSGSSDTR